MSTFQKTILESFTKSKVVPWLKNPGVEFVTDTATDPSRDAVFPIHQFLNWDANKFSKWKKRTQEALLMYNEDSTPWQAILDSPHKKKPYRYMAPRDMGNKAFLPDVPHDARLNVMSRYSIEDREFLDTPSFWDWIAAHPEIPIVITEGAKKTFSLLSWGYVAIGLYGCSCLGSPDLDRFLPGRKIMIAMDCDENPETRLKVSRTVDKHSPILRAKGAKVSIAVWEPELGKGIDDLLVNQGLPAVNKALGESLSRAEFHKKYKEELDAEIQEEKDKRSPFALFLQISTEAQVFRGEDATTYADIEFMGIKRTCPIDSQEFRSWLITELISRYNKPPSNEALQQVLSLLEGRALLSGKTKQVFLRTGELDGNIYLDLGTPDWQIAKITPAGWEIISYSDCPVKFYRTSLGLPFPLPTRGGDINELWNLVNVCNESKPLILSWLAFGLVPSGAKPIMVFASSKGRGKSSAARILKSLIDPGKSPLLPSVGDTRNIAITARGRWCIAYDNLSVLSADQQDALCCTATGAGFSHRTLHTNLDETFFEYRRMQILTGVDLVPTRSDLLDRSLLVKLNAINPEDRLTDEELDIKLQELSPQLLGCLLDIVVTALANLPNLEKFPLPRMASYAKFAIACQKELGVVNFMDHYQENINTATDEAIEANPISKALTEFLDSKGGRWTGTPSALAKELKEFGNDDPGLSRLCGRSLGKKLNGSLKGDLETIGYSVDLGGRTNKQRFVIFTRVENSPKQTSLTSLMSQPSQGELLNGDINGDISNLPQNPNVTNNPSNDGSDISKTPENHNVTETSPPEPLPHKASDVSDVSDVNSVTLSGAEVDVMQLPRNDVRRIKFTVEKLLTPEQIAGLLQYESEVHYFWQCKILSEQSPSKEIFKQLVPIAYLGALKSGLLKTDNKNGARARAINNELDRREKLESKALNNQR